MNDTHTTASKHIDMDTNISNENTGMRIRPEALGVIALVLIIGALFWYGAKTPAKTGITYEYPQGFFKVEYPKGWEIHTIQGSGNVVGAVNIVAPDANIGLLATSTKETINPAEDILAGREGELALSGGLISIKGEALPADTASSTLDNVRSAIESKSGVNVVSQGTVTVHGDTVMEVLSENKTTGDKIFTLFKIGKGIQDKILPVLFTAEYTAPKDTYDPNIATRLEQSLTDGTIDAAVRTMVYTAGQQAYTYGQTNKTYSGICEGATGTVDNPGILGIAKTVSSQVSCVDGVDASGIPSFAVEARLVNDGKHYFCVDSRGNAITLSMSTIDTGDGLTGADMACGD